MTHCQGFLSLSPTDRRAFCQSERLCFGCLRHGHSSRDCHKRLRCATCNRQHPTVLHDDNYQPRQYSSQAAQASKSSTPYTQRQPQSYFEASMPLRFQHNNQPQSPNSHRAPPQQGQKAATSMNMNVRQLSVSQHISAMIVPVYLSHTSCPGKSRLVYAMLDTQSDASFIMDETLNSFAAPTEETVINLSTMNATIPIMCRKADGFKVQGYGCDKNIFLPTLYSRPEFPNDRSHIPSANICNQYAHFKDVANKLMPLQNVEVGLLLGYDISYVHQPQEIISSANDSDPYAVRTPLGWCVIGSTGRTTTSSNISCNRIACSELTSIVYKTETTEVNPKDLIDVFEQDFKDVCHQPPLSKNDKRFLEITSERKQLPNKH